MIQEVHSVGGPASSSNRTLLLEPSKRVILKRVTPTHPTTTVPFASQAITLALHLPAHSLSDAPQSPILGISFNSESTLFATATLEGWVVYGTEPLRVISRREIPNSSLRFVLPLASTNLLFLVGGPPSPLYPPNKVLLWDDKLGKTVVELEFREDVRGLAARRDRLVVVLRRRVVIFVLGRGAVGVWKEGVYETTDNPQGLVALATEEGSTLLAFPGRQPGQVQLVRLPPLDPKVPPLPPPPSHDPTTTPFPSVSIILAHTTSLSALATNPSGSLIATTSAKGTLVRIWDPSTSHLVKELRRGTDSADIFGIAFRKDGGAICVSSDKGTVHVWDLGTSREEKRRSDSEHFDPRNKQFNILKPYLPKYFSSEWSHSQFRLPPPAPPSSRLPFSLSTSSESGGRSTPTVEDDVCICAWVEIDPPQPPPTPATTQTHSKSSSGSARASPVPPDMRRTDSRDSRDSSGSGRTSKGKERERTAPSPTVLSSSPSQKGKRRYSHDSSRHEVVTPPVEATPPPKKEFQIVALTYSGGWFRISLGAEAPVIATAPSFGLAKDSTSDCRLEEYRRFGTKGDW